MHIHVLGWHINKDIYTCRVLKSVKLQAHVMVNIIHSFTKMSIITEILMLIVCTHLGRF